MNIPNDNAKNKPTLKSTFPAEYGAAYERAKHREVKRPEWEAAIRAIMAQVNWPETPTERHPEIAAALSALWPAEAEVIRLPSQRADDLQLIRNGYEPIACVGKAPAAQAWQSGPITHERIVAMREAYPRAKSTGLRTGTLAAIDIDVRDPDHVGQIVELAASVFGDTPLQRFGAKGMLLCYRNDTPSRKVTISTNAEAKVEVLGTGQQFVAFGIHPDTGKPYEWRGEDVFDEIATPFTVPLNTLPAITPAMIADFADQCAELMGQLGYGNPRVRKAHDEDRKKREAGVDEDAPANVSRAQEHLKNCVEQGKVAVLGALGNDCIYELACVLMDRFYLSQEMTETLMLEIWYPHCVPNTLEDDVRSIIAHAASYIQNEPGANATGSTPETFREALGKLPKDAPEADGEPIATCDEPNKDGTRYYEGVGYRRGSDIKSEKLVWLWEHRVAKGAINMIAGLPAEGKSTIALDLAARITRGDELPCGGGMTEQGAVLIMSAEDLEKQTIIPRLAAAGAVLSQVFIVDAMVNEKDKANKRLLSLASDLEKICGLIEKLKGDGINVKLVIIDPISAYVGEGDGHKNTQMRALLTPLSKSAEQHKFGVVLISHYKKNAEGTNALYRVTDSLAFVASCRGVLLTAKEQDDDGKPTGRKLLLNGKPSLIPEGTPGLAYKTESTAVALDDGSTQNLPRIKWDGFVNITPDEAMAAGPGAGGQDKLDRAVEFLETLLADAPMPEKQVHKRAFGQRITKATLRRAKKKLGVISTCSGYQSDWWWTLVPPDRTPQQPASPEPTASPGELLPSDF